MGSVVSDFTDDVLGFDPNGGGIYAVANDVLGGDIADDLLGLDPNGGGIVPLVNTAADAAVMYAIGDVTGGLLGGESTLLGTTGTTAASADAAFLAADASQLAAQGLGEAQIADVLAAAGASTDASLLAASMASNGLTEATMAEQLTNLSSNTGLLTQSSDAAAMQDLATADAAQLAAQTNNNVLAIEQNLIAAGLDPLDAATLAQNSVLSLTPTQGMWEEFQNYIKQNPDVLNALGKAAVAGTVASQIPQAQAAPMPAYRPADTMAQYSPEYFQQVQQYYNTYLPSTPRDVATPLQDWYSSGYTQPDSVTAKLFGV